MSGPSSDVRRPSDVRIQATAGTKAPDEFSHWSHTAGEVRLDPKKNFRRHASAIRSKLREAGLNDVLIQRLVPQKGRISIDLSPEQITFISQKS